MLIEVAETHPPQSGKKLAKVKARTGQEFNIWPDKLSALQIGQRYDIEVEESEFKGRTYYKIVKVKPSAAPVEMGSMSQTGAASPSALATPPQSGEEQFVRELLAAFIQAGKIEPEQGRVITAVNVLRGAYRATFGSTNMFHASDVQHPRTARG
jgi:hypothetical protein